MYIANHAEGFAHQWGWPTWVNEEEMKSYGWEDTADEDAGFDNDPLTILINAEEANA